MGLLTDPSAGQGKVTRTLVKYYRHLSVFMYIVGILWLCCIAHPWINFQMYFSENALLPGLVKSEFRDDGFTLHLYNELKAETERYEDSLPYPWLLAKFRQFGLDTYTHNFTINYPFGKRKKYTGKNVYGILRAGRAASTEALVMSVPFRPSSSVDPTTTPSIAIMLAFAKFANKANYWSKDIIFVITEHEQLGMQAWLEAYHSVTCGESGILDHGELRGRGGAIQAAINLELHDISLGKVDIKIEGLNGQLPNLDLFHLCVRMCSKIELQHTFKNRAKRNQDLMGDWLYSFKTLTTMVLSQATGVPDGNHGLFLRFGIQALTLEGFPSKQSDKTGFLKMGFILESTFRSLNNLLERFHQSYFFYLLPAPDRFISIALYMPVIGLIAGAVFIIACGSWYQSHRSTDLGRTQDDNTNEEDLLDDDPENEINMAEIITIIVLIHAYGCIVKFSPKVLTTLGLTFGCTTEVSLFAGFFALALFSLIIPAFLKITTSYKSMVVFKIVSLLELGTSTICLSMYNCSLGLLVGSLYVPFVFLMNPNSVRATKIVVKVLWLLIHPLSVLTLTVFLYSCILFSGESLYQNLVRSVVAVQQGIVYAVIDSMIYNNWLFNVITCVIMPNWVCFWVILFSASQPEKCITKPNKKDD